MAIVNKEITAKELMFEIVRETEAVIETLGLTSEEAVENQEIKLHIRGIQLIGEAWKLESEEISKALEIRSGTEDCEPFDGKEGMEVQWGLFRTAVMLDTEEKRKEILKLAQYSADFYALEAYVD